MQKHTNQVISEPTANEISSSIYYIRMNESDKKFHKSNNDMKIVNFRTFLSDINDFITNEPNQNLIKYYIPSITQKAMQFCTKSVFNQENTSLLFDILSKTIQITMNISYSDFTNFMFSLMNSQESVEILKKNIKTLEAFFSNDSFFSYFVNQQQATAFFEKAFIKHKTSDLCYLYRHLVCEISTFSIRQKINLSNVLPVLLTAIKPEMQIDYSIVLSKLISASPRNRLFLNNNQSFFLFSNFIQSASSETVKNCFEDLVFANPANIDLLSNIILFYQKYPKHQKTIFNWIFHEITHNHTDMLHEINETVPFFGWITLKTKVGDVINAIIALSNFDVSFVSPFFSPLFSLLNKGESTFIEFQVTIQIIERQIHLHQISLSDLANSHFLTTFVINVDIDILGQLFEKIYTFSQLIYDIYALKKSRPLRQDVIYKLIQMIGKYPKNAQYLSIFLVVSNSKKNISDLMKMIIERKSVDLCEALGDSFTKSKDVVSYFIDEDGIGWLDKVYNMNLIDLKKFIFLINSLTKNRYIKDVDKYINSLPKDHLLFKSISQEDLMTLSYGFENSHHFYPLKITSLFPLLKCPQIIDPYNAYMIGKHVFDNIKNKEKFPILSEIVNRYITDETFEQIIKLNPSLFDLYCNLNFDHFPLFQVEEFFAPNVFDVKFKGLSFWFKFDETLKGELKVPFFCSDKLQLFIKDTQLYANYEGTEYDTTIDPFKWNNIIIIVSPQKISHYVNVYINLSKAVFISSRQLNELPNFEFSTYSSFMFIGTSIRVYQNDLLINDTESIFANGPSFAGHFNESFSISPSSKGYLNPERNIFAVKYRGFPSYFLSEEKRNLLFNRMTDSHITEKDFLLLISSYFKVYLVYKSLMHDFIPSVLTVISKVPRFASLNLLLKSFKFFLKYKNKDEIVNTIVGHEKLWSNFPNDLIIVSLFITFGNFNFYKEKKQLELFFVTKSFYDKGNPKVIEYLYNSSKYCQSILCKLFEASNFVSTKQDKFTQCNIGNDSLSKQNNSSVENHDQNNISIQCDLSNEQENKNYYFEGYLPNFDSICLFQTISNNAFQNNLASFVYNALNQNSFISLDIVYDIFITSDTEMKNILYPILLNYEKVSPNSFHFNQAFLCFVPQLFNSKNVWKATFNLLSCESTEITKHSFLPVIFSLFWGVAAASLHSIASTGKQIQVEKEVMNEITKIINILSNEKSMKIVTNDKNVLKLLISWIPFLLGVDQSYHDFEAMDEKYSSQTFNIYGKEIAAPNPFCFLSMIWRNVIKEANLPLETKKEHYNEMQSFIVRSKIFNFLFNFIFSLSDSNFIKFFNALFSITVIRGNNELTNCFLDYFMHSLLNIVAENYSFTLKIEHILPFIHFMCLSGHIIDNYLPIIVSDLFLVSSVISSVDSAQFGNLAPHFSHLLLNLFFSALKASNSTCINVIYQVLHQQIILLSKMAAESNETVELYLLFFRCSAQFCASKETYLKVVSDFCKELKITQNEKLLEIENGCSEIVDLSKFDDFVKEKIDPLVNKIKVDQFSFSFIHNQAKQYVLSFLNSLENQKQAAECMVNLFLESKKFIDSKIEWNKSFYEVK